MASDWIKTTLDDVCIKITDGAHKSPKSVDSGKPMASVKDLEFYGLNLETARHISEEDYDDLVKQGCKPELGDVLIAKDGNSALDTVCTFEKDAEVVLLSSVAILRPNPEKINSRFLKYYFLSSRTIEYLKRNFISGAAIPRVVLRDFKKAEISLPLIPEQKAIAHILGSLDDKIELNRQMNETLEAMAQALFKSWFVDFDPVLDNALAAGNAIPDEFIERAEQRKGIEKKESSDIQSLFPDEFEFTEEMGWIPKGWSVNTLEDLAVISSSKRIFAKEYQTEGVPFYRGKEISLLSKGEIIDSDIYISRERFTELKDKFGVPKNGDMLLTSVGTIGNVYLVNEEDEFYFKDGNLTWFSDYKTLIKGEYLLFWFNSRQAHLAINDITIGSTQQALTISSLNGIKLLKPSDETLNSFNKNVESIIRKSIKLKQNREILAKLRDTLLPKLMSGELRIPDADAMIEDV